MFYFVHVKLNKSNYMQHCNNVLSLGKNSPTPTPWPCHSPISITIMAHFPILKPRTVTVSNIQLTCVYGYHQLNKIPDLITLVHIIIYIT